MAIRRLTSSIVGVLFAMTLSGCSTLKFWGDDEPAEGDVKKDGEAKTEKPAEEEDGGVAKSKGFADESELKLAKLWARVDELEEEQFRQKERIRVLEKGITLGLVPEELKTGKGSAKQAPPAAVPEIVSPLVGKESKPEKQDKGDKKDSPSAGAPALTKEEQEKYQTMLATAQEQYRSGRYGRAIVEYDALGKQFGDKVEGGLHRFWIAKSWANLKEDNTSRQLFSDFIKESPSSPWVPRAKLELARVEWRLGLQETSISRLKDIIQAHPHEDAAEMARMELEQLDKSL